MAQYPLDFHLRVARTLQARFNRESTVREVNGEEDCPFCGEMRTGPFASELHMLYFHHASLEMRSMWK